MSLSLSLSLTVTAAAKDTSRPPVEVSHFSGPLYKVVCAGVVSVVASVGDDGILLVDTGYTGTAAALRKALTGLGGGPIRIIVNTHGDMDHVSGNAVLGEESVIISHPVTRQLFGTFFALPPISTAGRPTMTVEGEATTHFNDDVIRLLPVPDCHRASDLLVHFRRSGVVCLGDLVMSGSFADADPIQGGDAQRLAEVLHALVDEFPEETIWVPGHGATLTTAEMQSYLAMIDGTLAAVRAEVAAGRSLGQILLSKPLAPWAGWARPANGLGLADWTTDIHASLTGAEVPQSICMPFTEALLSDGIEAAVALYRRLSVDEPDRWSFAQRELNTLGYQLLWRDRVEDAITIFRLDFEVFPDEFDPCDSLGEAYMVAGQTEQAILNYQRSLDLNPGNHNAAAMLKRLRGEWPSLPPAAQLLIELVLIDGDTRQGRS